MYPSKDRPFFGTFVEQQIKGLQAMGVEVEVLLSDRAREGVRAYWRLGRSVRERVGASPDLIHVMYGGVTAEIVTRAVPSVPVIVSFCGSDLLGEHLPGFVRKLMVAYGVRASHRAARRAAGIVVKSRNLRDALPRGLDPGRVKIIPNGVDLNRFKPMEAGQCRRRLSWDPDRFHVLFPANTGAPLKRLWLAQAALAAAEREGLASDLHLLQGVPHKEVPVWLNASDVVLLTSEHEGSPNVIKEALACNVPVISVDVGDVAERIEGIEGCFLAAADAASLAAKLHRVRERNARVDGRIKMDMLSLENVTRRLISFYQDVLAFGNGGVTCGRSGPI
jgi:glycosyltransferase involved in cell wall biosynthesis